MSTISLRHILGRSSIAGRDSEEMSITVSPLDLQFLYTCTHTPYIHTTTTVGRITFVLRYIDILGQDILQNLLKELAHKSPPMFDMVQMCVSWLAPSCKQGKEVGDGWVGAWEYSTSRQMVVASPQASVLTTTLKASKEEHFHHLSASDTTRPCDVDQFLQ